ncbi:subtilisin-like serine endopeptidase family protein [Striga asiatica]|uniref:Subtilisin-like serine endopeptidase family protein n=1 Tax=Striga asiatica TaxID=4170 RepID=A0A5A7PD42_STRAF|nr:subtilisin-like serine endopeptidase family protein [Striga asiatica]
MGGFYVYIGFSVYVIVSFLVNAYSKPEDATKSVHIVYMGATHSSNGVRRTDHVDLLQTLEKRSFGCVLRTYNKSFLGFTALLSNEEAKSMEENRGVVSVFPDSGLQLHTTHSWDFLWKQDASRIINKTLSPPSYTSNFSSENDDTIIGIIDTGIWPEAPSFRATPSMRRIPKRWKGGCMGGPNFTCNGKVIGARYYENEYTPGDLTSARDEWGHGTHTASTAAGMPVGGASYYGLAEGTARGGSPSARIAMYRVCGANNCTISALLKAIDDAIDDGVDVLSMSLGMPEENFLANPIVLGAFHAALKGITVVCSAGNDGPSRKTVENFAPWILTVGATTIDRDFEADIILDGRTKIKGGGINFSGLSKTAIYPLIYGASAASNRHNRYNASHCFPGSLDHRKVNGKILLCENDDDDYGSTEKFESLKTQGGVGIIVIGDFQRRVPFSYGTYAIATVSKEDGAQIRTYINSNRKALATILPTATILNTKPAPVVIFFSSRGPPHGINNLIKGNLQGRLGVIKTWLPSSSPSRLLLVLLYPDVVAPGVGILAAWPPLDDYQKINGTNPPGFAIDSGTSMSCPHVSGLAALVRSRYPKWGPSAIRSAIMTTAIPTNNLQGPITTDDGIIATPYDIGSGEISLTASLQPGLVYETDTADYIQFLCNMGYNTSTIQTMASNYIPHDFSCPCDSHPGLISNMNYPSIAVSGLKAGGKPKTVQRTVTNVGEPNSIYTVSIEAPRGLEVEVEPKELQFTKNNKQSFQVTFKINTSFTGEKQLFGSLTWVSSKHKVRSPFAVSN